MTVELDPMGEYFWNVREDSKHYKIAKIAENLNSLTCDISDKFENEDSSITEEQYNELNSISCDLRQEIAYLDGWRRDIFKEIDDLHQRLNEILTSIEKQKNNTTGEIS